MGQEEYEAMRQSLIDMKSDYDALLSHTCHDFHLANNLGRYDITKPYNPSEWE